MGGLTSRDFTLPLALAGLLLCSGCGPSVGNARVKAGFEPSYLALHRSGELRTRADELWGMLADCRLCPRQCGADRLAGQKGDCQADSTLLIASHHPDFGEEKPLTGRGGSGAISFSGCALRCVFCANWEVSQGGEGTPRTVAELADMMLALQTMGCHNINLVTPAQYAPHILRALDIAAGKGLRLPLVWNTCGYERAEVLERLEGVVDIYLPDFKYCDTAMAAKHLSGAADYPQAAKAALLEMNRQVGVARPDADGLVYRGLMVRHPVMPNDVADSKGVIDWIAAHLPKDTYVDIVAQYLPCYRAGEFPEIARRILPEEHAQAVAWALTAGLTNLDLGR